jgi:hypothetical protein
VSPRKLALIAGALGIVVAPIAAEAQPKIARIGELFLSEPSTGGSSTPS